MKNERKSKGITLISLVITIIVLLILAGIAIATLTGENGILTKATHGKQEHIINQYKEEINLAIAEEVAERKTEIKTEQMIQSLDTKIKNKTWVNKIYKLNEEQIEQETFETSKYLLVESKEKYEILIKVENDIDTAEIISIQKGTGEYYIVTYNPNKGTGETEETQVRAGFSIELKMCNYSKENYKFVGWCENSQGEGEIYSPTGKYKPEKNVILYAIWARTKTYLYNQGEINSQIGDIVELEYVHTHNPEATRGTFNKETNNLSVKKEIPTGLSKTEPWADLYITSKNKFDFTDYSKLYYSYSSLYLRTGTPASGSPNYRASITFGLYQNNSVDSKFDKYKQLISPDGVNEAMTGSGIVEIDIAGYDKIGYIKLRFVTSAYQRQATNITIDKIWVE